MNISIPSGEVSEMSDEEFDALWNTIIATLPVISSVEEITEKEKEEEVEQDEA